MANQKRRDRVIKLAAKGLTQTEIAKKLGITGSTVSYYITSDGRPATIEQELRESEQDDRPTRKSKVKKGHKHGNSSRHEKVSKNGETPNLEVHIAYVFGKVETLLEHYADSAGLSRTALTNGLAEIFLHKTSGKVLGSQHHLPVL